MTILEATTTGDNAFAAPEKGFVVKSGAAYRSEQGSDYEPGVSAETVGSKSIWLGMITLPPGKRTRAHVHEHHETALYMLAKRWNCGLAINSSIETSCVREITSSFRRTCCTSQ